MSSALLLLAALVASAASRDLPVVSQGEKLLNRNEDDAAVNLMFATKLDTKWEEFKFKHEKSYKDLKEEEKRKKIFSDNVRDNEEHNERYKKGLETYTRGVNQFSDLTITEFLEKVRCFNVTKNGTKMALEDMKGEVPDELYPSARLPEAVDWRSRGAVTPVKNQGWCGSCWAFAAVGAIEGQTYIKYRLPEPLSEQNLVDCASWWYGYKSMGCWGGWPHEALRYVKDHGISTEEDYQYEAEDGECRYDPRTLGARVGRVVILPWGSEAHLQRAVAFAGPVVVAIDASGLFQYHSGVLSRWARCSRYYLNHAVLVVGYKSLYPGQDYWIVKNSWGTSFGMDGYFLIERNRNVCGMGTYMTYADVI